MKKMMSLALALVMCLTVSVSAFATENTSCDIDSPISESWNVVGQAQDVPTEVGEVKAVTQLKDGSMLYVKLVECKESSDLARSSATTTRTYMFQVETFGQLKNAWSVESTCLWQKQGFNSVIDSFFNTYVIYDSNFSCSWGERYSTDLLCNSVLDITSWKYGNNSYIFYVNLLALESPILDMGYDHY